MQGSITIMYVVAFFLIFYFMLLRPQKKKTKELTELRDSLKTGDTVTTIGGIMGKVVSVNDEDVVLSINEQGSHISLKKWSIGAKS
jgi:preprotein translocase subunit YajC